MLCEILPDGGLHFLFFNFEIFYYFSIESIIFRETLTRCVHNDDVRCDRNSPMFHFVYPVDLSLDDVIKFKPDEYHFVELK